MPNKNEEGGQWRRRSSVPAVAWPALPNTEAARLLSVLFQLESSQWWNAGTLEHSQFEQLALLLRHAYTHVPWYRDRLEEAGYYPGMPVQQDWWRTLPLLDRESLQNHFEQLKANAVPAGHSQVQLVQTSGSTGRPISALTTNISRFFYQVLTLRDHFWQRRDFSQKFVAIRPDRLKPDQRESAAENWGFPVSAIFQSGPSIIVNSNIDVREQLDLLSRERPGYLLTVPEIMKALASLSLERGERLNGLCQVRSYGGVVSQEVREVVREAWGVPLIDVYSSVEVGYFALQCPQQEHYHVQSEGVLLEVLNDEGEPCGPGETGRVVVTTLHNFAMPLIRYQIGDYAEVGEPCPCGRGLPVLKRILGRSRNILVTPEGARYFPSFPSNDWAKIGAIRQLQLTQDKVDHIQVKVAIEEALSPELEQALKKVLTRSLRYPFAMSFTYVEEIPRLPNHKFEDFISLIER